MGYNPTLGYVRRSDWNRHRPLWTGALPLLNFADDGLAIERVQGDTVNPPRFAKTNSQNRLSLQSGPSWQPCSEFAGNLFPICVVTFARNMHNQSD